MITGGAPAPLSFTVAPPSRRLSGGRLARRFSRTKLRFLYIIAFLYI
jgi:hypothetical protein